MGRGPFLIKQLAALCILAMVMVITMQSCAKPGTKGDANPKRVVSKSLPGTEDEDQSTPTPVPTPEATGFESTKFPFEVNMDDWKLISDEEGVQTFQKKTQDNGIVSFRGEALIPASLAKIATILNTESLRKEWVDSLVEARTIEHVGRFDRIEYNHSKVPWPFQDRDFVYKVNVFAKKDPMTMLLAIKSIQDPRVPPVKDIVRGEIVNAFYYMKEVEGVRATKVVVEMAVDPKGAIPLWMMNMVQKNWPLKTLENLRKLSQREEIVPTDEIRNYFQRTEATPTPSPVKPVAKSPKKIKSK